MIRSLRWRVGIVYILKKILGIRVDSEITDAKRKAYNLIHDKFGSTIAFGPFKGMVYQQDWWGGFDINSKILGEYELEILNTLVSLFSNYPNTPFIDIGAADGYYSIGIAFAGFSDKIYAFELSELGKETIAKNANLNNCKNKINILGEANQASIKNILKECKERAIILIDIEGGEYNLLDNSFLSMLKNCDVIIELHPSFLEGGNIKENELLENARRYFNIIKIYRGPYNPNQFEILNSLSDNERLLALSEGRARNPKWVYLKPKNQGLPS